MRCSLGGCGVGHFSFSWHSPQELLDKTSHLNHYYFVSLMALLLVFLPTRRTDQIRSSFRLLVPRRS